MKSLSYGDESSIIASEKVMGSPIMNLFFKEEMAVNKCKLCQKETKNKTYCSRECSIKHYKEKGFESRGRK